MRICLFGSENDKHIISTALSQVAEEACGDIEIDLYSDYDDLLYEGSKRECDIVFVTVDSAAGMEGVIVAKKVFPAKPVIWFSNDNDFATQAYRLQVAYFHTKPMTVNVLKKALEKSYAANRS